MEIPAVGLLKRTDQPRTTSAQGLYHSHLIHLPVQGPPANLYREESSLPSVDLPIEGPFPRVYNELLTGLPVALPLHNFLTKARYRARARASFRELINSEAKYLLTVQQPGKEMLPTEGLRNLLDTTPHVFLIQLPHYTFGISPLFRKLSKYLKRLKNQDWTVRRLLRNP